MQSLKSITTIKKLGGKDVLPLPALSSRTLSLPMDGSFAGTHSRLSNAWNPETGQVAPHNLLLQSQTYANAAWNKRGTASVTDGQPDRLGGTGATLITVNTPTNDVYQEITYANLQPFFLGVWFKKVTATGTLLFNNPANASAGSWSINLSNIPVATWVFIDNTSPYVVVTAAMVGNASKAGVYYYSPTDGPLSFYVAETRLNQYSLTPYVPTTTAAVYLPRYVSGNRGGQAMLIEEASSQLHTYSSDFTQGTNGAFNNYAAVTVTPNVEYDPFNIAQEADRITSGATAGGKGYISAATANTTYTYSVYLKASTVTPSTQVRLQISTGLTGNLVRETAGSLVIGSVPSIWTRYSVSATIAASGENQIQGHVLIFEGLKSVIAWGAQLEALPYATSPIVSGATVPVTRAADVVTYPTAGVLTAAQGTISLWVKVDTAFFGAYKALFDHESASTKDIIRLYIEPTGKLYGTMSGNGGTSNAAILSNAALAAGWIHVVRTWSSAEEALWVNGVKQTAVNTSPANVPSVLGSTFRISNNQVSTGQPSMPIDNLNIYNRPLTASEVLQVYRSSR